MINSLADDQSPAAVQAPPFDGSDIGNGTAGAAVSRVSPAETQKGKPHGASPKPRSGLSPLLAEDLPAWDALVDASPQGSAFCKSWWLRAACGQVQILGYFESGQLIAGIPLFYTRRMGLRLCWMPLLTQTMGVVISPLRGKYVTIQSRETSILDIFAARLEQEPIFVQAFHPASQNWLPFYWRGFTQTTHYTYVLDDLESLSRIWEGLAPQRRSRIRSAQRRDLHIKECGPEIVYRAAEQTYRRQKLACPYRFEHLQRLVEAARSNGAGRCLAAEDSLGRVHAACFFVWDRKRGYYLAGGQDPALASSGAPDLLRWNLIEFASANTQIFDFEGSMHKPIEESFRSYGAKKVAYSRITKLPRWLRIAVAASGRASY